MWNPPGPGIEPMLPALAGGILTTEPLSISYPSWNADIEEDALETGLVQGTTAEPLRPTHKEASLPVASSVWSVWRVSRLL